MATGGQSIWVQAIVTGSGYTMTGEGYDFAGTGFDIEKFYELKGVDNAGEYWGGALFDCVLSSGDIYIGRKAFEYVKGGKKTGTSYDSFNAFKKANPVKTQGNQWHHIVEQNQAGKSGFSVQQINNTKNLIELTPSQHSQISGYYSSIDSFTGGLRVRDWLAGQSFDTQYQFGIDKLKSLGFIK